MNQVSQDSGFLYASSKQIVRQSEYDESFTTIGVLYLIDELLVLCIVVFYIYIKSVLANDYPTHRDNR